MGTNEEEEEEKEGGREEKEGRVMGNINKASKKNSRKKVRIHSAK